MQTLTTASDLQSWMTAGRQVVVLDCGFDLAQPAAGEANFLQGHLPGARYVNLDRDLSGAKTGNNGRHPLPDRAAMAQTMGRLGIQPGVQVVTYDDQGLPYAARAWWVLRWMGHEAVAVLDGGRAAWVRAGGTLEAGPSPALQHSQPYPVAGAPSMAMVGANQLQAGLQASQYLLIDARAAERFRGDVEPLDPVAGHIPGASNRFFKDNLAVDGCFKPAEQLRREFQGLAGSDKLAVVHQCGSGVTACHNLLAMAHAGLDAGALYPGSWSEWCSNPQRPVAKG